MYGVVGAADVAKFGLFMSLGVNKLTYANFSNADDTIHAKTMTESLKDVFKPVLSLPIIPAKMAVCSLFLHQSNKKIRKNPKKNFIFQFGSPMESQRLFSFNDFFLFFTLTCFH